MNKRVAPILFYCLMFSAISNGQYYYKDILSTKQLIDDKALYQKQKVKLIQVHSIEPNGEESKNFFCEKKISKNYLEIEAHTQSDITGQSVLLTSFNTVGLINKTVDSSDLVVSTSLYQYDDNKNLLSIISSSHSNDEDFSTSNFEKHQYFYKADGTIAALWIIKNNNDTTIINFKYDKKGNITDEVEATAQKKHYYYYYDEDNNLTDIVKYNPVKRRLLPDFMFEFNTSHQLIQMISSEEGPNSDYYVWKYFYNDDGLRIIEKCYSKEKILMGSFEYEYK